MTDFNWKPYATSAQTCGSASSGDLRGSRNIKFVVLSNQLSCFDRRNEKTAINKMEDVPVRTFHYAGHNAMYTWMNAEDEFFTLAWTEAISNGTIIVQGPYSCANSLCTVANTEGKSVDCARPVPILFDEETVTPGFYSPQNVSRGRQTWKIHRAHFGGNEEFVFSSRRIYMAGGSDEEGDAAACEPSGDECWERVRGIYSLGRLRMWQASSKYLYAYKTDCLVAIRAEDGKIAMRDCQNLEPGADYLLTWDYDESYVWKGLFLKILQPPEESYVQHSYKLVEGSVRLWADSAFQVCTMNAFIPSNYEVRNFGNIMSRIVRRHEEVGKQTTLKELSLWTDTTPQQVLAYFAHMRLWLKHVGGFSGMLQDRPSSTPALVIDRPPTVEQLLGYCVLRHKGQLYRVSDQLPISYEKCVQN